MTSLFDLTYLNSTLFEELFKQASETSLLVYNFIISTAVSLGSTDIPKFIPAVTFYDQFGQFFQFDEFQAILLKTFLLMQVFTLLLIFLSWKVYGKRISERFMKPATSIAIQELKDSVSRLKLPKEHTPRI